MNKNNFLVNFIISVKVNEVEKINLEQDLDRQLYINEINVKVKRCKFFATFS